MLRLWNQTAQLRVLARLASEPQFPHSLKMHMPPLPSAGSVGPSVIQREYLSLPSSCCEGHRGYCCPLQAWPVEGSLPHCWPRASCFPSESQSEWVILAHKPSRSSCHLPIPCDMLLLLFCLVDSNDSLYGGDSKFLAENSKLCEAVMAQILEHLKTLAKDEVGTCPLHLSTSSGSHRAGWLQSGPL